MVNGKVDLDVVSLRGPVRPENEDAAAVWSGDDGAILALVADGMGGHSHGRQAAEIVVRTCLESVQHRNGKGGGELLRSALGSAHARILEKAGGDPTAPGGRMGATAVAALVEWGEDAPRLFLAHAGDSRAYLVRGNSLIRLTQDHSLVAQLIADGHLDESEAFGHPDSNIIHRALGQATAFEPEIHPAIALDSGDRLVLCSDGLHDFVRDQELLRLVIAASTSEEICRRLSQAAIDSHSQDNVSVACIRFTARQCRRPTKVED